MLTAGVASAPLASVAEALGTAFGASFGEPFVVETGEPGRLERSAPFGPLMARMREVLDLDPAAVW